MSRNRLAGLVVITLAASATIGFSTMTFGESNDAQCWDEYNGRGTRKTGRLLTAKGVDASDCTPAKSCFQAFNADRSRVVRLYVPMGANAKTICNNLTDVTPTTVAPKPTFPPIVTIPPPTTVVDTTLPPATNPPVTTAPPPATTTPPPATTTPPPPATTTPPPPATTTPPPPPPTTTPPPPPTTTPVNPGSTNPPAAGAFAATFDTPEAFFDEFDFGFSGFDPAANRNSDRLVSWTGDHDQSCGSPGTPRTINIDRNTNDFLGGSYEDFQDLFWWCRGHVMTGVSTVGYTIAWFSPKQYFTNINRVCWDINTTEAASRKWTQVLFVSEADATANPSPRGSGGFDLGYTNPMFQDPNGPHANIFPQAGDLAGVQLMQRGQVRWFENQTQWTTDHNVGQPIYGNFDKATRYTHCLEQIQPGTIRFTQERPDSHGGFQQVDMPGNFPDGPVKVVWQDDNYNGPKSENHNPEFNTWHWDNLIVETGG